MVKTFRNHIGSHKLNYGKCPSVTIKNIEDDKKDEKGKEIFLFYSSKMLLASSA